MWNNICEKWINLSNFELLEDLRFIQADTTKKLCKWFVRNYPSVLKKENLKEVSLVIIKEGIQKIVNLILIDQLGISLIY